MTDPQFRTFEVDYFVAVWPWDPDPMDAIFDGIVELFARHGLLVEGCSDSPTSEEA